MAFSTRRKVSYFYNEDTSNFYYGPGHFMKPVRMRMTHNLLLGYNLFDRMDILTTPRASELDMTRFHTDEYINFLRVVTPDNLIMHAATLPLYNIDENDCPVLDGLWDFCRLSAGGSLAAAARLNSGESNTVINWAGGFHHAKRSQASGFCYINDCVLAILELLKVHARVLYVDIDIHHGDGVEEAFYTTDRVMTVSFHKDGSFFPGTGKLADIGIGRGRNYAVNVPLHAGIGDESYREIFVTVMRKVMEMYQPGAVVLQCGADSLSGDRIGCFNLSIAGHANCVDFFGEYDVPLLMLGGGGYTISNVARCWAYETSKVLNEPITDDLPFNKYYEYYGPDFRLHIVTSNMDDQNTHSFLNKMKAKICEQLRGLSHAPSIPFMDVPRLSPLGVKNGQYEGESDDPDTRVKNRRAKHRAEYEDSDDESDDEIVSRKKRHKLTFPRRKHPSLLNTFERRTGPLVEAQAKGNALCCQKVPLGGEEKLTASKLGLKRESQLQGPQSKTRSRQHIKLESTTPALNGSEEASSEESYRQGCASRSGHRYQDRKIDGIIAFSTTLPKSSTQAAQERVEDSVGSSK